MGKRKYLLFDDVLEDETLCVYFDACVEGIQKGELRPLKTRAEKGYPSYPCFKIEGKEILVGAVLNYYLFTLQRSGFVSEAAEAFAEKIRILCGWQWEVYMALSTWIERVVRDPFFFDASEDDFTHQWVLKKEAIGYSLSEEHFQFACYIAVCFTKYGQSWDGIFTKEIFYFVTALGSRLPQKMKKHGSGRLPQALAETKTKAYSCVANDVFATIKITIKEECEETYEKILDYLCALLECGFPKTYAIECRGGEKIYLPIKHLPKKGVHRLFANMMRYPNLYAKLENYARLAMNEFEWYHNLENEFCAMPGTFAVFGLGLADEKYHQLVCDYLLTCDGEHQSVQGDFVLAYVEKFGFTPKGLELYRLCEKNIQHLPKKLTMLYKKSKLSE